MKRSHLFVAVITFLMFAHQAMAATLVPVKPYVKPGEPVQINFLQPAAGKADEAKKDLELIGLEAAKLPGVFAPAPRADVLEDGGKPLFTLYSFDGKKLDGTGVKLEWVAGSSVLDISMFYPQLKEPGTYILAWKDSAPLLIEVLRNPTPWGMMLSPNTDPRMVAFLKAQAANGPVVATHIVPLEYGIISTDKGDITITFAYEAAPNTVANYISLSKQKFYDGSAFHRTIKGFMIQGGDSVAKTEAAGSGGPGYQVAAEINDKKHERGTLSMARSQDVDSAGSQFFIMHAKAEHLDGAYTAFGQVLDGLPVVDKIVETPVTDKNGSTKPEDRVTIKSITILPATLEHYGIKK